MLPEIHSTNLDIVQVQIVINACFFKVHIQLFKNKFLFVKSTEDSEKLVKFLKF